MNYFLVIGHPAAGVSALLLTLVLVGVGGCAGGCAGALLEGVLTERDGDLVVVHEDTSWSRYIVRISHRIRDDGNELVVVDWLGIVKARGDFVGLGGGDEEVGTWNICGMFEVRDQMGERGEFRPWRPEAGPDVRS